MSNIDIRMEAKRRGIFMWQIAERYGISDSNFSKKLRRELPESEKAKILDIIHDIAAEREVV